MSDQLFTGLAPTAPAGKEYFFYSGDSWIAVHDAIQLMVEQEFPYRPIMTAESAASLAALLTGALEDGAAENALADVVSAYFNDEEDSVRRRANYTEDLLDQLREFTTFLAACGGCEAD